MIYKLIDETKEFYDNSYAQYGFKAQRRYPNEEFCRFVGRNFLDKDISVEERSNIKILETGCGSGANLWVLAREGFDAYGIDLSSEGIGLAEKMIKSYGVSANLSVQNMCRLKFDNEFFDAVIDVFSSYCLTDKQGDIYLQSVAKIIKQGGT